MEDQALSFDVVVVGAGPAGLAFAIRLAQQAKNQPLRIALIDKGADVGSHTLSGALLDTSALDILLPDWQQSLPNHGTVRTEAFHYLTAQHALPLPVVKPLKNKPNTPIVSITHLCRWLAQQAKTLGIDVFPGFSATQLCFDNTGCVCGIQTGDRGRDRQGKPTEHYQPGIKILAPTTVLAEGCHGTLSQHAIDHFQLRPADQPQTYGLGIREVWDIDASQHRPGHVLHTLGWPLQNQHYGGGFVYHLDTPKVVVGFVTALDYDNPTLDPHATMQQFKTHPSMRDLFSTGKRLHYGAKALVEGGIQSLPTLHFPGGCLVGDTAGFLNVGQLKGIHNAMHSGIMAADALHLAWQPDTIPSLEAYSQTFYQSQLYQSLHRVRNLRPGFHRGQRWGLVHAAIDQGLCRGRLPWTLAHRHDHQQTKPHATCSPITYPKPDGVVTFDKPSSLYLSHTQHEEQQPCHLKLKNPQQAIDLNWRVYGSPEQYYCPAGVYDINPQTETLQMYASNCLHCKTCAIKDPSQNIVWTPPQGGEGPHYDD